MSEANESVSSGTKEERPKVVPFHVLPWHYLLVDEEGYIQGDCREGAFGFVVKLLANGGARPFALKFPRLFGDTLKENYHISDLMVEERRVAWNLPNPQGLIEPEQVGTTVLHVCKNRDLVQNRALILLSYSRRTQPRIAAAWPVKKDDGSFDMEVYPKGAAKDIREAVSPEHLAHVHANLNEYEALEFTHYFQHNPMSAGAFESAKLAETVDLGNSMNTWYAGVPAAVYRWADVNLQAALGRGMLHHWGTSDYMEMLSIIVQGACSLHSGEVFHADIRPANVMCYLSANTTIDPKSFRVADYGSFRKARPRGQLQGAEQLGHTLTGHAGGNQRSSVFYAPERRSGIERETADAALIIPVAGAYYVKLGWFQDLLPTTNKQQGAQVSEKIVETCEKEARELRARLPESRPLRRAADKLLVAGDRVRVREFIFEVEAADSFQDGLGVLCRPKYYVVVNDRICIEEAAELVIKSPVGYGIRSYTIFHQWSAATDIYGIGAVSLYCSFVAGWPHEYGSESQEGGEEHPVASDRDEDGPTEYATPEEEQPAIVQDAAPSFEVEPSSTSTSAGMDAAEQARLEEAFEQVMEVISSVDLYRAMWKSIHEVAQSLFAISLYAPTVSAQEAAALPIGWESQPGVLKAIEAQDASDGRSAREAMRKAVQTLVAGSSGLSSTLEIARGVCGTVFKSVPHSRVLLQAFRGNLAQFTLYLHFCMACLHRRESGLDAPSSQISGRDLPFCASRLGAADPDERPIDSLQQHMRELTRAMQREIFDDYVVDVASIEGFDAKSMVKLRLDYDEVHDKYDSQRLAHLEQLQRAERLAGSLREGHTQMETSIATLQDIMRACRVPRKGKRTADISDDVFRLLTTAVGNGDSWLKRAGELLDD